MKASVAKVKVKSMARERSHVTKVRAVSCMRTRLEPETKMITKAIQKLTNAQLKLRKRLQGKLKDYNLYRPFVYRKIGLEIGGPSDVFSRSGAIPLYPELIALDQCNYKVNASTAWAHVLLQVPDAGYDVVASSHVLEHCANPIKALKEWQRVLRPDGALILVLPFYGAMFDHNRCPTTFEHMENDFRPRHW